ncbi:MAG: hypothetical protein OHK0021_03040 [Bryobacter sp.]
MRAFVFLILVPLLSAQGPVPEADPKNLTAMVSFLASDALKGRDTPSEGLDIAAEYIASEFRRAGLEPLSGSSYFQTARMRLRRVNREGFTLNFTEGEKNISIPGEKTFWTAKPALNLTGAKVRKLKVEAALAATEKIMDPVVILAAERPSPAVQRAITRLSNDGVALVVLLDMPVPLPAQALEFEDQPTPPTIYLRTTDASATEWMKQLPEGATNAKANVNIAGASTQEQTVRNVLAKISGNISNEYVLLSAHYDHLGVSPREDADRIFNGANDNASGVASLLEAARLIQASGEKPAKSLIFAAWFGEERGLLGSRYFTRNPLVPLAQIKANLNLEQTGRTDGDGATNLNQANLTGYHFSNIHASLEKAASAVGFKFVKHERFSDPFFTASDNEAFAQVGIPATTLSVAYQFADYHRVTDHWEQIDYNNMAKVTRAIAQGMLELARSETKISWDEANEKTKAFVEAGKRLLLAAPIQPALSTQPTPSTQP